MKKPIKNYEAEYRTFTIVIFDTNIYRNLIRQKSNEEISLLVESIRKAETAKKITAKASAVVGLELASNIKNEKNKASDSCLKGAYAMTLHLTNKDEKLSWLSLPYNLLSKKYFNFEISYFKELETLLFAAIYDISKNKCISNKDEMIFESIKKLILMGEKSFVNSIKEFITQLDPETPNWQIKFRSPEERKRYTKYINSDIFFDNYINSMIKTLTYNIPEENRKGINYDYIINDYKNNFRIPFLFRKNLMMRFANENYIMDKNDRANYLWDEMILYLANQQNSDGERFILVTEDNAMYNTVKEYVAMNNIAKEYDSLEPIYKKEEYLKMLGINL